MGTLATVERAPGGLVRYVLAATLARGADGGAAVGVVLLATMPSAGVTRPALVGGLLATCLTAPHLLGPVVARRLDRARDGRPLIAGAVVLFGLFLAVAALLIGRVHVLVVVLLVTAAGTCGPLLTGGLSSRLAGLVDAGERAQRRAQGWDGVTYGIAWTAGPAATAALAAVGSARLSVVVLGIAAVLAAALTLVLPPGGRRDPSGPPVPLVRQTIRLIAVHGPLRRVTVLMVVAAIPAGALAVLTVALSGELGASPAAGAAMVAAFGFGHLLGCLALTAFPLTGKPEVLSGRWVAAVGVGFVACAAVPTAPLGVLAFGLLGVIDSPFFTATLAARSEYSPPGARAQVFVSMAGLKIAGAALGSALGGALIGLGARPLLVLGGVLICLAAVATVLDRRYAKSNFLDNGRVA